MKMFNLKSYFILFISFGCLTCDAENFLRFVLNMENFIFSSLAKLIFNDCNIIKTILGKSYEQLVFQAQDKLKDVHVKFFTDNSTIRFDLNDASKGITTSPFFSCHLPTVIFIHGYTDNTNKEHILKLANDIKTNDTVNFLALDHSVMTSQDYLASSTYVKFIAEAFGPVLTDIYFRCKTDFYLIGHSLGAYIAGLSARIYKYQTGVNIKRITGLDPAGPCFFGEGPNRSLMKTDAELVDVIHTNVNIIGLGEIMGHVDFYPNNGIDMPGCYDPVCCHKKSFFYFWESVKNNRFSAHKCSDYDSFKYGRCYRNSKILMGYWLRPDVDFGNYYLNTAAYPPYALDN